jgi:hypothetical protein
MATGANVTASRSGIGYAHAKANPIVTTGASRIGAPSAEFVSKPSLGMYVGYAQVRKGVSAPNVVAEPPQTEVPESACSQSALRCIEWVRATAGTDWALSGQVQRSRCPRDRERYTRCNPARAM